MRRITASLAERNLARRYRAASIGTPVELSAIRIFTNSAAALKPLGPANLLYKEL